MKRYFCEYISLYLQTVFHKLFSTKCDDSVTLSRECEGVNLFIKRCSRALTKITSSNGVKTTKETVMIKCCTFFAFCDKLASELRDIEFKFLSGSFKVSYSNKKQESDTIQLAALSVKYNEQNARFLASVLCYVKNI